MPPLPAHLHLWETKRFCSGVCGSPIRTQSKQSKQNIQKNEARIVICFIDFKPKGRKKQKKKVSLNCNAALGKAVSRSVTRSVYHKGSVQRRCSSLGKLSPAALEASCLGRSDVSSAIIPDASHGVVISINSSPSLNHRLPSAARLLDRHTHQSNSCFHRGPRACQHKAAAYHSALRRTSLCLCVCLCV